jgi:tetratricopeptide (TPR) repeat protein
MANLYFEMGELIKSIDCYQRIVALEPNNSDSTCNLANLNFLAGKRDDARALFSRALALDPRNSAALRGLEAVGGADRGGTLSA